jgi:hypothetical protein
MSDSEKGTCFRPRIRVRRPESTIACLNTRPSFSSTSTIWYPIPLSGIVRKYCSHLSSSFIMVETLTFAVLNFTVLGRRSMSVNGMLRQLSRTSTMSNMRRRMAVMLLFALSALWGCNSGKNALIVLDDQWAAKQAQTDCESRKHDGIPLCTGDPITMIRDFEAKTAHAFNINTDCKGITLVTLNGSEDPSLLNSRHTWWLFLELMRSNDAPNELRYTVSRHHDAHRLSGAANGQGKPDSIVREFCSFVRQGGYSP